MQGSGGGSGLSGKADGRVRRDDLECAPRCFAHNQRKEYFIGSSETPAGVSELLFHGDYPLSLLTAFAASSPKGTPYGNAGNFAVTAKAVPLGKVA